MRYHCSSQNWEQLTDWVWTKISDLLQLQPTINTTFILQPRRQPDSTMKLWRRLRTNPTSSDLWGRTSQPRRGTSADLTVTANRTSARYLPGGSPWATTTSRRTTSASRATTVWGKTLRRWEISLLFFCLPVLLGATTGTTQRTLFPRNLTGSM